MVYKEKRKWKTLFHFNNGNFYMSSPRKIAVDLGLKIAGAAACYGLGTLVGEGLDNILYINQWIPQAVDFLSGIDVVGNLDGLVALFGGIYGFTNSGTGTFKDNPDKLEKITLAPICIHLKK